MTFARAASIGFLAIALTALSTSGSTAQDVPDAGTEPGSGFDSASDTLELESASTSASALESESAPESASESASASGSASESEPASTPSPDDATDADAEPVGWDVRPNGFVRAGYEYVTDDPRYDFVGDNFGFVLGNARAGLRGLHAATGFRFDLSFEGAAELGGTTNSPEGTLGVRLVDGFIRYDVDTWLSFRLGQFKVPFMREWIGRDGALPFASRAVGQNGVPVGRGLEEPGIVLDRELGLVVESAEPIRLGDFGVSYHAMVFNGNGIDQLLNDNANVALTGRLVLSWGDWVHLGGGILWNPRTIGPLPDRFQEDDLGLAADLEIAVAGIEFLAHFTEVNTTFGTTAAPDQQRLELHLQGGYALPFVPFPLVVGYRFAYYDPYQNAVASSAVDLSTRELVYHTVGLRLEHPDETLGLTVWLNYTFTVEAQAREVQNDRLQVLAQIAF